jgi:hypothetical protein
MEQAKPSHLQYVFVCSGPFLAPRFLVLFDVRGRRVLDNLIVFGAQFLPVFSSSAARSFSSA